VRVLLGRVEQLVRMVREARLAIDDSIDLAIDERTAGACSRARA
jgi:hypothetical protein